MNPFAISIFNPFNTNAIRRCMFIEIGSHLNIWKPLDFLRIPIFDIFDVIFNPYCQCNDFRYLIIIDDLWEASAWTDISCGLPENDLDSIIIATTRNESVANECCLWYHPGHFVHKVGSLNYLDSRKLFLDQIFGSENNCPNELEDVSMKILKKCAGLPLAIVCKSSLLAATWTQLATKWENVCNSLGAELKAMMVSADLSKLWRLAMMIFLNISKSACCILVCFPRIAKLKGIIWHDDG